LFPSIHHSSSIRGQGWSNILTAIFTNRAVDSVSPVLLTIALSKSQSRAFSVLLCFCLIKEIKAPLVETMVLLIVWAFKKHELLVERVVLIKAIK